MAYKYLYSVLIIILFMGPLFSQNLIDAEHYIAAIEEDKFHGWPANNGVWQWGDEIVVGYTQGDYVERGGHNMDGIEESMFSRSLDGGKTWEMFKPDDFMADDNIKWTPEEKKYLESPLNFKNEGFALRFFATGYHGNDDPEGGFYYSYDRGSTWEGPFYLGRINDHKELKGKDITARTDYLVLNEEKLILFISANSQSPRNNRIASIKTNDGGLSFEFISWVTPDENEFNPIMSNTVKFFDNHFIMAYRNRYFGERDDVNSTIEIYESQDGIYSWSHKSTVKQFELAEGNNTNPPAMIKLKDGRLLCIYGDRDHGRIAGKYSEDRGKTWGEEFIIRDDFKDLSDSKWDFGYPVLLQREDGRLVAIYYWATSKNPKQYIAASVWEPTTISY